ncbi:hypothetical protein CDAR_60411 [Caerostris darwini]|uniref:Uncharacterized protein n=1 Tax=Caerostris darwini TaxID=1538125 RepID=A0AAV4QKT5_9ARAC|nr:hypothetical protein CDAR_60411 [Caerostris darwini]
MVFFLSPPYHPLCFFHHFFMYAPRSDFTSLVAIHSSLWTLMVCPLSPWGGMTQREIRAAPTCNSANSLPANGQCHPRIHAPMR